MAKQSGDQQNKDLFFTAVYTGDIDRVKEMLLTKEADVNDRLNFGEDKLWSALMLACWNGHYNLAKFLLENGADVNLRDDNDWSALLRASYQSNYKLTELLLDYNAEVDQQNKNGWTALMCACKDGRYEVAQILLQRGRANPNIRRVSGRTALMSASGAGRYEEVKLLLKFGAQVTMHVKDSHGYTASDYARQGGHKLVVDLLSEQQHSMDAFVAAVKDEDIARVKVMLHDEKVGVNDRFKFGKNENWSALMLACQYGYYDLAKCLLNNGADVNIQDDRGWSALKQASFNNHYEVVKLLLDHGAEVNQQNHRGWTALMNACKNGHYEIAQLLLERSADPNIQRKSGRSALMSASEHGRHQEAELLLKFDTQIELRDNDGKTALTYATVGGHSKVVKILITERADINSQDNDGLSALMKACNQKNYYYGTMKLLLEKGAEVDLCAKNGWSALMYASNLGHYELVKLLLHHGAAIDIQSGDGQTPLDLAQTSRHYNVVELLEREVSVTDRSYLHTSKKPQHGENMSQVIGLSPQPDSTSDDLKVILLLEAKVEVKKLKTSIAQILGIEPSVIDCQSKDIETLDAGFQYTLRLPGDIFSTEKGTSQGASAGEEDDTNMSTSTSLQPSSTYDRFRFIMSKYSRYVIYIRQALEKKGISIQDLRSDLLTMPATNIKVNLLSALMADHELKKATTLYEIFDLLEIKYTSFLNYEIFQFILEKYEINYGEEVLKYPEHLKAYLMTHEVVLSNTTQKNVDPGLLRNLVLQIDIILTSKFACLRVEALKTSIAEILCIKPSALHLQDIQSLKGHPNFSTSISHGAKQDDTNQSTSEAQERDQFSESTDVASLQPISTLDPTDLKLQLKIELKSIILKYSSYVSYIRQALKKKGVTIEDLCSDLMTISAPDINVVLHMKKATTINDVFDILVTEYASFLNYNIFQFILEKYDINHGEEVLKYPEHVKAYLMTHKVSEFFSSNTPQKKFDPESLTKKLVLQIDIILTSRFSPIEDLKTSIAKILGLNPTSLQFYDSDIHLNSTTKKYSIYVSQICNALMRKGVSAEDLCSKLLTIPATSLAEQDLPFLSAQWVEQKATSLNGIFKSLETECASFLNCDIFQYIVEYYQIDHGEEVFRYPEYLKAYLMTQNVTKFVESDTPQKNLGSTSKELVLQIDMKPDTRMDEVMDLKNSVAEILHINPTALQFLHIKKGCDIVTFQLPTPVANLLFHKQTILTELQKKQIQASPIQHLQCNGRMFNFTPTEGPQEAEKYIEGDSMTLQYNFTDTSAEQAELLCVVCLDVVRTPLQHEECGKLICKECLEKHGRNKPCPHCRTERGQFFRDTKSGRDVQELGVKCTYNKNGCIWEGTIETLEEHQALCHFTIAGNEPTPERTPVISDSWTSSTVKKGGDTKTTKTLEHNFVDTGDELHCMVCLDVVKIPLQHDECGKLICKECLEKHGRNKPCPHCKTTRGQFFIDKKSRRDVENSYPSASAVSAIGSAARSPLLARSHSHPLAAEMADYNYPSASAASTIGSYTTMELHTCDHHGCTLSIDDITVTIPPGAIPEGTTVHIEIGVALYGPFKFPDDQQPVSPILWFCIKEDIELLEPITYRLPHIIKDNSNVELTFAKANHRGNNSAANTDTSFTFQALKCGQQDFTKDALYGSLSTKDFCYLCIQAKNTRELALKKGYCLHACTEKKNSTSYQIIFVCTYFLQTCFKALKELYPEGGNVEYLKPREFHFNNPNEQCLTIEFVKDNLDKNLSIHFEYDNKIQSSKLDFWEGNYEFEDMKLRHEEKMYPPQVSAVVYSNSHEEHTAAILFKIEGAIETLDCTIVRPFCGPAVNESSRLDLDVLLKEGANHATPTLMALIHFRIVDGTCMNLAKKIGANYHDFGVLLLKDNDGSTISAIELKQGGDPADINRRIFQLWLQGKGKQPITWATLIAVLRDIEMKELAKNMEETLIR